MGQRPSGPDPGRGVRETGPAAHRGHVRSTRRDLAQELHEETDTRILAGAETATRCREGVRVAGEGEARQGEGQRQKEYEIHYKQLRHRGKALTLEALVRIQVGLELKPAARSRAAEQQLSLFAE